MKGEEKKPLTKGRKIARRIIFSCLSVLTVVVLIVGIYVVYVLGSYNRIGDIVLNIEAKSEASSVEVGTTYKALSYNIGFGAYSQDYTFFMDEGYDDNGNKTCGYYSKSKSKQAVEFNTTGAINTVLDTNPDFVMFQEVDTLSTRSYCINQDQAIMGAFPAFDHIHARNFHTAFLPWPLYDMHGEVNGGITTLSRFQMKEAQRKQYTVATSFSKYFDLDRCFSYAKIAVNGQSNRFLYLVNSHMSAYDEGGTIREIQIKELNAFLSERKAHNDYVVVGGDFNHDLLTFNPEYSYNISTNRAFEMTKKKPDWLNYYFDQEGKSPLVEGYHVEASDNAPTCRNNDIEWEPGNTFVCTVDGFIVSDNIKVVSKTNIQTKNGNKGLDGFAYSDHDPALLCFKLKA